MKSIIILIGLIGLALSAPVDKNDTPTLLKYENTNDGSGSYSFAYETSDGTSRREEGTVKHRDDPEEGFVIIIGSFSYVGSNGVTYTVNYVADENGFQPQGSHLPGNPASKTLSDPRFNDRKLI